MEKIMRTDDLVLSLTKDFAPVPRRAVERRIALGLAAGAVAALIYIAIRLGLRPDLGMAMLGFPFWMKWLYTISLATGAVVATIHLARPDATPLAGLRLLAPPILVMAVLAGLELARTPSSGWPALLAGQSADVCSLWVLWFSLPIFAGLVWAFRRLAPANLRLAGLMAGLASGASSATLYSLHCPESAALFILVWYTLGMALAGALGALAGPRLLRW
jgi:hypothetical protein